MRAIELIGEAPEHDGRVVVVIPNHAPQVLFNAVVVRFGGIWTKVINPWNLCLYNQAQCIALFKRIGIVWIMGKAHKVAAQLCNCLLYTSPYEQMKYPGQRVQIDVKFVPQVCIVGQSESTQWFQYTFLDEYSRFRYIEAFQEHNTLSLIHI